MKTLLLLMLTAVSMAITLHTAASDKQQWKLLWQSGPHNDPESIVYDPNEDVFYVSNQFFKGESGQATISKLNKQGQVIEDSWLSGLNEPKGLAIKGSTLFVTDIDKVHIIDIPSRTIISTATGKGIKFLNDVALDNTGTLYVAEMMNSAVYRLDMDNIRLVEVIRSEELINPNGLLFHDNKLYIAGWGKIHDENPANADKGALVELNLTTMEPKTISHPIGQLDGLQLAPDMKGFLATDYLGGNVYYINPETGNAHVTVETPPLAGDILYIPQQKMLFVPQDNTIYAYQWQEQ
ncbi:hypothetical protein BIZ37_18695 [Photobacterium sp. BZF1]|uniref:SMP-30/gluconolactonase/LRE family protein n=1 Tax=Photobacterium sp. BZF1 TaxID=1904457 RepID=UPI001653DDB3|nr:hypothetical protein [Photobacterium sp. BZF1]MBC7004594.1 hypothetical protein [Photobacterium sp. BZF1]